MIDALTRHQILLQRHFKGIYKDIEPLIKKMVKDLNARISSATPAEFERLTILRNELNAIINSHIGGISDATIQRLIDFYEYESKFTISLLDKETIPSYAVLSTGLAPEAIGAVISTMPIVLDGKQTTVKSMIKHFGKAQAKNIELAIQTGIASGRTTDDIVRDVMAITNTRTRKQAEAVILTAANATGAKARAAVWDDNSDILQGERYSATLDSRTTVICASLDRNIYPIGTGPQPPLHYRCRSIRVPALKPEYELQYDKGRSSTDGVVSSKTTYSSFLKRQSKEFQDEVLGVERAKLFRSGKLKLDQFVDKSGKLYTLEQLARMDLI